MGTASVTLPVPSANGPGASIYVGNLGKDKTIVIEGDLRGVIDVEGSIDGIHWCQIPPFFWDPDSGSGGFVVQFMRSVVSGYFGGSSICTVGAPEALNDFVDIPVPAVVGPGGAVPTTAFGDKWTIIAGLDGPFRGAAVIEVSHDGITWAQVFETIIGTGCQSERVAADFVRVNRVKVVPVVPGPLVVSLGAERQVVSTSDVGNFPDCGPPVSGFFEATDEDGDCTPFPTVFIWWTSSAKVARITDKTVTRDDNQRPIEVVSRLYAPDGVTVVVTVTDTLEYDGGFACSRTRVVT